MKKERIVKIIIFFKNGIKQVISIKIKSENDLEFFKNLKFKNIIRMIEIK